jgi:hypothetical protein
MRLLVAVALGSLLIPALTGADIERAMALGRARDADRQQFHRAYVFDLPGPVVTQVEVITEFRRLVIIAEEHVQRGDWMFTRGIRAAQDALGSARGMLIVKAQVRFSPLNTFIEPPPYTIAMSGSSTAMDVLDTQVTPQYSVPFKTKDKKTLSSLLGATLETTVEARRVGQGARTVAVLLAGKETGHTVIDFRQLE